MIGEYTAQGQSKIVTAMPEQVPVHIMCRTGLLEGVKAQASRVNFPFSSLQL